MQESKQQLLERIAQLERQLEAQTQRNQFREKDALVLSLLQRNRISKDELEEIFTRIGIQPKAGALFVLATAFGAQEELEDSHDHARAMFVARNMIDDLFSDYTRLHTRDHSVQYCILLAPLGQLPAYAQVAHAASVMTKVFQEEMGIPATVFLSEPRNALELVHGAYTEIERLRQYIRYAAVEATVVRYGTLCSSSEAAEPTRLLQELHQELQLKRYELAQRKALEALEHLQRSGRMGVDNFEIELYHVINPLLDRLQEALRDEELDPLIGQQVLHDLRHSNSMVALRTAIVQASHALEAGRAETEQNAPNWMLPLLKQLRTDFRDPNLNVNYIADQIGITPVHMSRVFRKFQGFGIMDYIHQLRVEDAKQLIMNGCSVKNAMSMVGYTNQLTMTRAFKRLDGSTPGQYAMAGKSAG